MREHLLMPDSSTPPHVTMRRVFLLWVDRLEYEPGLFGLRLFARGGGLVWRNKDYRESYGRAHGYLDSATFPWSGAKHFFTKEQLESLTAAYAETFASGGLVETLVEAENPGNPKSICRVRMLALAGNMRNGLVVTHSVALA